jgi:hypothetical protein
MGTRSACPGHLADWPGATSPWQGSDSNPRLDCLSSSAGRPITDKLSYICLSVAKLAHCSINRQAGRWDSVLTTGGPARSERNRTWRQGGLMWECFLERFDAVSIHRSRHALPASRPQVPKINAEGRQVGSRRENFDILSQHEPRSFLRMFCDPTI